MSFKFQRQLNTMDCGPSCLRMICSYYKKKYSNDILQNVASLGKSGISLHDLCGIAEKIGFRAQGVQLTYKQLAEDVKLPCILHWDNYHFVVLLPLPKKNRNQLLVADPASSMYKLSRDEFLPYWETYTMPDGEKCGVALLLEPTAAFYANNQKSNRQFGWKLLLKYLSQSRWAIYLVVFALLITTVLQLVFPFLTQSIVDIGIETKNVHFITLVLIGELMLVLSRAIVDFIRTRLLLQISITLNLSILSAFWVKLTKLPMSYFDRHLTGDTMQRIGDHRQIQNFLTGTALNTIFSVINFIVFAIALTWYNVWLFFIFIIFTCLYILWVRLFLGRRRKLNYQSFYTAAKENAITIQLVQGMQEIKLHNAERQKRLEWENLQSRIYKLTVRTVSLNQLQQAGAVLLSQGRDMLLTFIAAGFVIEGKLSLGAMLAIQYIIGQLSSPVEQFVAFAQTAQDAKISVERLNEVHQQNDEEDPGQIYETELPAIPNIRLENVCFAYPGGNPVLDNITLEIPHGKTTAIVGVSGSGKTTLLKLMLKFYTEYAGNIFVGQVNFNQISPSGWRKKAGAVMQDGYIFNDTIAKNIAVGIDIPDVDKLMHVCRVANILSFIESLPNGFSTIIGAEGNSISQGQRQRILIARAVYKDPTILFFDEATNALDANNEKAIVNNLGEFLRGRTVVIVAHRLSTVKKADKIIVLDQGKIIEEGTHDTLSALKGEYYQLVKNQLELGN